MIGNEEKTKRVEVITKGSIYYDKQSAPDSDKDSEGGSKADKPSAKSKRSAGTRKSTCEVEGSCKPS